MKSIILLVPYFGKFPEWAPLYFETLRRNSSINFLFYTDCDTQPYENISNVEFRRTTFEEYNENARRIAKITFQPANSYKLCDLRPLYPIIHYEDIKNYDFYGWTDMDIFFGDIRQFYTDELLNKYDVFSTHQVRISGHFALFRNTAKNRNMYKKIYDWRNKLAYPYFVGIDEHGLTNAFTMTIFDKFNEKFKTNIHNFFTRRLKKYKKRKLFMKEQYTTPFTSIPWLDGTINSKHPDEWYYKDGKITNNRDGDRNFIYLHFMNFKNSQWRHDETKAPWEGKEKVCFATANDMKSGIVVNANGIFKI